jgi:hypothetical protein
MSVEKFKKGSSIMDGASSEWDESKHPRDSDGKFASGAGQPGGGFEKSKSITDSSSSESDGLTKSPKNGKLVINSPEAVELYDRIKSGNYLSYEELLNNPVVKQMDKLSAQYDAKYGSTIDKNTPERKKSREEWKREFLKAGSFTGKDASGKDIFNGSVKRGYKMVIAIGLPASGKSTGIANPDSRETGAFVFDSDEVKKLIPEYKETNGGAANSVHKESKDILAKARDEFLTGGRKGDNLVVPVIGENLNDLRVKWIMPFEAAGYDVEVRYQDADPIESANRVISRAIATGRIIPSRVVLNYKDKPRGVYEELKKLKGKGGKPYVRS